MLFKCKLHRYFYIAYIIFPRTSILLCLIKICNILVTVCEIWMFTMCYTPPAISIMQQNYSSRLKDKLADSQPLYSHNGMFV